MNLVEKHIINKNDELDLICFKCKNLYNKANYIIRQEFINNGRYINKFDMFTKLKDDFDYKELPSRVARCVIRTLDANWRGFFETIKDWKTNRNKYKGKPNLPNYLKKDGKFNAIFIDCGILKPTKKNPDTIGLSSLKLRIKTKILYKDIVEVNIKPLKTGKYQINIVYKKQEQVLKKDNGNYCSIDLGLNNLMTLTSNKRGVNPLVINGRPLKSINQFYNKQKATYQSELPKGIKSSKKITKLGFKRELKINDYLHKSSHFLINYCLKNQLNTIIIGYNEGWKHEINIGKRNNQNFVSIPFEKLINLIEYKAKLSGLIVKKQEEAYTSKCSFLDLEPVKQQVLYKGLRICRGLFQSQKGLINADVNGSYNILRKAIPNVFSNGIEGVAAHPKRLKSFK